MKEASNRERMKWIDVYKGIMIILVVVGHATSRYNLWIYQFHMAAFFFISGYLFHVENENGLEIIIKKFMSIMMPYFVFSIIGILSNFILDRAGLYSILFGGSPIEVGMALKELFLKGNVWVQYLGTFWFLPALFGVEVLHIILYYFIGEKTNVVTLWISSFLYLGGYFLAHNGINAHILFMNLAIIFISQFYFFIGMLFKKMIIKEAILPPKRIAYAFCVFIAFIVSFWGKMNSIYMDLASKTVGNPISDVLVACASILIVLFITNIITRYFDIVGAGLLFLGKNSIGIMIFHFIFFKIFFIVLYKHGIMDISNITEVVLPAEYSDKYWLLLSLFSLFGSLFFWVCLKKIPILRTVLGQNKEWNKKVSKKIGLLSKTNLIKVVYYKFNNKRLNFCCFCKEYKKRIFILCLFIVVSLLPMYRTGIIINDELQARSLAMQGFIAFFKTNFSSYARDGRVLASFVNSIFMYLGFIGAQYGTIFKIGQIIIIVFIIVSFGWLIYKIFGDYELAVFSASVAAACLSITFEHVSPNAFVALFGIPFLFLLLSLSFYIEYIEGKSKLYVLISMILFLIAQMSYETFITYVLLYFMIAIGKTGYRNIRQNIRLYVIPLITATSYLLCYILCSIFFSSEYSGNQIGFVSLQSSLEIIVSLFVASIPGFYVFSPKYQIVRDTYAALCDLDYLRISVSVFTFGIICIYLLKKNLQKSMDCEKDRLMKSNKKRFLIIVCALSYMIFPSLPISISEMYQGNVGKNGFLALLVNFFEYFAAVFVLSYALILLNRKVGGKFYIIITLVLCVLVMNVQQMNDSFSREQNNNFERLVKIENMLKTDTVTNLSGKVFASKDLYKSQNTLGIHDGYWTIFCNNVLGKSLQIVRENTGSADGYISFDDDNFTITTENEIFVLSLDEEHAIKAVNIGEENYILFDFINNTYNKDKDFYVYTIERKEINSMPAGYSVIEGVYNDGWLMKNSRYSVRTGEGGKIHIVLYYPGDDYADHNIEIFLNGIECYKGSFEDQVLEIDIDAESNEIYEMQISCDFEYMNKGNDLRELAVLLFDLVVQ